MKKKILTTVLLFATISILTNAPIHAAKAAYCSRALESCYDTCGHSAILSYACDTGCNIGYLFCG